jgi:lipoprotein NlpI
VQDQSLSGTDLADLNHTAQRQKQFSLSPLISVTMFISLRYAFAHRIVCTLALHAPKLATITLSALLCIAFSVPVSAQTNSNKSGAAAAAERAFSRGNPLPDWVRPITELPPASPTAPYSIRLADTQFFVAENSAFYTHRASSVRDASGLTALAQLEIEFQPDYQTVQLHKLRILRGTEIIDKTQAADIRFLQRELGLNQGMYSGEVTAAIVMEDVRVGDTVEIEYSVFGENPVFGGKYFHGAQWDYSSPASLRHVVLNMPRGKVVHHKFIGADQRPRPEAVESYDGDRHLITFEGKNLPAVVEENYVPADVQAYRWIQFSEFNQWKDVNKWALDLFKVKETNPALEEVLKTARAAKTKEEAVAKVLEFVQNDIRYLSISLGQNSHRPYPPEQVLERRYGDCKDKALLMVTLLRELNIEAAPVLVSTYYRKNIDQFLPSPINFDHAIVRAVVNGQQYYLDGTRLGQYGALNKMGQVHANNQVLVVQANTNSLATIPAPTDDALITDKRTEIFKVGQVEGSNQNVDVTVRMELAGASAEYMRTNLAQSSKDQLQKWFEGTLVKRYPDAELLGEPVISDDRKNNQLRIESRFRIKKLFTEYDDGWSMDYLPANMAGTFYTVDRANRHFPFAIPSSPSIVSYDIDVTFPEKFSLPAGKYHKDVINKAFSLDRDLNITERNFHANYTLRFKTDRVQPSDLSAYLEDYKKFNVITNGSVSAYKSYIKASTKKAISVDEQLRDDLDYYNKKIANDELKGVDISGSLCDRARVQSYLGNSAAALNDVNSALKLKPNSVDFLICRADIEFFNGQLNESETDYRAVLNSGTDTFNTHFKLGLIAHYRGKSDAAKASFDRAILKSNENIEKIKAAIFKRITSAKDAVITPSAVIEVDSSNQWLEDVLELYAGEITPEHLIKVASRNAGDYLEARLVEAYFYIGKYYQFKQDRLKARVYFQRALDKKRLINIYNRATQYELLLMAQ